MKTLIASAALLVGLGGASFAQESPDAADAEEPAVEADPALDEDTEVVGAVGLATGAVGETFFIRTPQEYHLLSTELPGQPVFLDTTATGMQHMSVTDPGAEGTVDEGIAEGERPLGEVVELLIDRRGGAAALVIELDEAMRGGEREIAVAMGLVRMLPDADDPAATRILLSLDPLDLENAPDFVRRGAEDDEGQQTQ
jgi:hypothetical protein